MPAIQIDDEHFQFLTSQAAAAGYVDVAAYVKSLADDAAFEARFGMTDESLRESAAECDDTLAKLRQKGGQDFRTAWKQIGGELGFSTPE